MFTTAAPAIAVSDNLFGTPDRKKKDNKEEDSLF